LAKSKKASGIYQGRLLADGYGNLLADEGPNAGEPVAYHDGSYVFISGDEPSHNDRHHENFAVVDATTDESNAGEDHHLAVQPDDPHYTEDEENLTRMRFSPDKQAATETGHTDAYTKGDD
jgi:hypothetical protein